MAKARRQGHWCWCCGGVLSNERFSSKGHGRHSCRACSKVDPGEKECRQVEADLERAWRHTFPFIHKSRRKWFDGLATSSNEKIRKLHAEVTAIMDRERELERKYREEDERALEQYPAALDAGDVERCDDDIPF